MAAAPVLGEMGVSTIFMEIFLAINILAVVFITVFSSKTYEILALLALLAARGGYVLLGNKPLMETSQAVGVVICLVSAVIMLRFILSEGFVTSERIFSALGVYLLVGIM